MIIQIDDWKFQVFTVTNRRYYAREWEDRCQCAWCRNFCRGVDTAYPSLRGFLDQFGVHVEAPDEMMAYTPTLCHGYYAVCGEILERGNGDIMIDGVAVSPQTGEEAMVNTTMDSPTFFLQVGCMMLPWVLDEPMEEADSPARGKKFLQRLLSRWIEEA